MESSIHSEAEQAIMTVHTSRKIDLLLLFLLSILVVVNAYLAHYASINHAAFDEKSKQVVFVLAATFGLPFICLLTSLCFPAMRKLSNQLRMFTLTSAIVFVSNMPLLALAF